jgi:HAMP domain-containing protein
VDTSNWEFAAAVTAVCIGLAGLLLFTLIGTFGSWRVFDRASRAASEAAKASLAVQDLARYLTLRESGHNAAIDLTNAAGRLEELRQQADALMAQQTRLQDAVRNLVEAGVLGTEASKHELQELENAVRRLEENLARVVTAVTILGREQT